MKRNYKLGQKLVAYILLFSFFLQSCSKFSNSLIPAEEDQAQLNKREVSPEISKQVSLEEKVSKKFIAQGGHIVAIREQDGQLQAIVEENLPESFSRQLVLPVYGGPELSNIEELSQHKPSYHKRYVRVCFPEKDSQGKGYVYIGKMGLMGGGKDAKGKKKESQNKSKRSHQSIESDQIVLQKRLKASKKNKKEVEDINLSSTTIQNPAQHKEDSEESDSSAKYQTYNKSKRETEHNTLTIRYGNDDQSGRKKKNQELSYRELKDFSGERETQLLKQFTTLLYWYMCALKEDKAEVYELQTMHVNYQGKTCLFIAGSKPPITALFSKLLGNPGELSNVLKEKAKSELVKRLPDEYKKIKTKKRVDRYTSNFVNLFEGQDPYNNTTKSEKKEDIKYYKSIVKVLRSKQYMTEEFTPKYKKEKGQSISFQDLANTTKKIKKILEVGNKIVFINTSEFAESLELAKTTKEKLESRHAELFLTDIAELIKKIGPDDPGVHICVAGKRRPCLTCYTSMECSKAVDVYGKHPGLFWAIGFEFLPKLVQCKVLSILASEKQPLYMTVDKKETETKKIQVDSQEVEKEIQENIQKRPYKKVKVKRSGVVQEISFKYLTKQEQFEYVTSKQTGEIFRADDIDDYATGTDSEGDDKDVKKEDFMDMEIPNTQESVVTVDNKENKKEESIDISEINLPEDDI